MIYTVEEIRRRVSPVAKKYSLRAVYLFGSYARNEATEDSDVDILIDKTGSTVTGLFDMSNLYNDLTECIDKDIDLITTHSLEQRDIKRFAPSFAKEVYEGRVLLYGKQ